MRYWDDHGTSARGIPPATAGTPLLRDTPHRCAEPSVSG